MLDLSTTDVLDVDANKGALALWRKYAPAELSGVLPITDDGVVEISTPGFFAMTPQRLVDKTDGTAYFTTSWADFAKKKVASLIDVAHLQPGQPGYHYDPNQQRGPGGKWSDEGQGKKPGAHAPTSEEWQTQQQGKSPANTAPPNPLDFGDNGEFDKAWDAWEAGQNAPTVNAQVAAEQAKPKGASPELQQQAADAKAKKQDDAATKAAQDAQKKANVATLPAGTGVTLQNDSSTGLSITAEKDTVGDHAPSISDDEIKLYTDAEQETQNNYTDIMSNTAASLSEKDQAWDIYIKAHIEANAAKMDKVSAQQTANALSDNIAHAEKVPGSMIPGDLSEAKTMLAALKFIHGVEPTNAPTPAQPTAAATLEEGDQQTLPGLQAFMDEQGNITDAGRYDQEGATFTSYDGNEQPVLDLYAPLDAAVRNGAYSERDAVSNYMGTGYQPINDYLRTGDEPQGFDEEEAINNFDSSVAEQFFDETYIDQSMEEYQNDHNYPEQGEVDMEGVDHKDETDDEYMARLDQWQTDNQEDLDAYVGQKKEEYVQQEQDSWVEAEQQSWDDNNSGTTMDDVDGYISDLDSLFERPEALAPANLLTFRKGYLQNMEGGASGNNWEPGEIYQDKGFVSMSLDQDVAGRFAGTMFAIEIPKGTKAAYLDAINNESEQEMLLPREAKFMRVGDYDTDKGAVGIGEGDMPRLRYLGPDYDPDNPTALGTSSITQPGNEPDRYETDAFGSQWAALNPNETLNTKYPPLHADLQKAHDAGLPGGFDVNAWEAKAEKQKEALKKKHPTMKFSRTSRLVDKTRMPKGTVDAAGRFTWKAGDVVKTGQRVSVPGYPASTLPVAKPGSPRKPANPPTGMFGRVGIQRPSEALSDCATIALADNAFFYSPTQQRDPHTGKWLYQGGHARDMATRRQNALLDPDISFRNYGATGGRGHEALVRDYKDWLFTLTKRQRDAVESYQGHGFTLLNTYLRTGKDPSQPFDATRAEQEYLTEWRGVENTEERVQSEWNQNARDYLRWFTGNDYVSDHDMETLLLSDEGREKVANHARERYKSNFMREKKSAWQYDNDWLAARGYSSMEDYAEALSSAFTKQGVTPNNMQLFRASSLPLSVAPGAMNVGDIYVDKGYVSTSTNSDTAKSFGDNLALIEAPEGLPAIYAEMTGVQNGETEMILPRNSQFVYMGMTPILDEWRLRPEHWDVTTKGYVKWNEIPKFRYIGRAPAQFSDCLVDKTHEPSDARKFTWEPGDLELVGHVRIPPDTMPQDDTRSPRKPATGDAATFISVAAQFAYNPSEGRDYHGRWIQGAGQAHVPQPVKHNPFGFHRPLDDKRVMGTRTGGAAGSNTGGFWTGTDNQERYVKAYDDPVQAHGEVVANELYRALGLGAPKSGTFVHKYKLHYASEIVPGSDLTHQIGNQGITKERANRVLDGFAADVLMANWDVLGMGMDNVLDVGGQIHRIDNGSAFLHRAQGARKPTAGLSDIPEWTSLAPGGYNSNYAQIWRTAGFSGPEDPAFRPRIQTQVATIAALRKKLGKGGWAAFVKKAAPSLKGHDYNTIVDMLESRTKRLVDKTNNLATFAKTAVGLAEAPRDITKERRDWHGRWVKEGTETAKPIEAEAPVSGGGKGWEPGITKDWADMGRKYADTVGTPAMAGIAGSLDIGLDRTMVRLIDASYGRPHSGPMGKADGSIDDVERAIWSGVYGVLAAKSEGGDKKALARLMTLSDALAIKPAEPAYATTVADAAKAKAHEIIAAGDRARARKAAGAPDSTKYGTFDDYLHDYMDFEETHKDTPPSMSGKEWADEHNRLMAAAIDGMEHPDEGESGDEWDSGEKALSAYHATVDEAAQDKALEWYNKAQTDPTARETAIQAGEWDFALEANATRAQWDMMTRTQKIAAFGPPENGKYVTEAGAALVIQRNLEDATLVDTAVNHGMTVPQYLIAARAHLKELVDKSRLSKRTHLSTLGKIIRSGRILTQFESGTSSGFNDNIVRADQEKMLFGHDKDLAGDKRPVYGYLADSLHFTNANNWDNLSGYGDTDIIFKDSLRDRATFVAADSLGIQAMYPGEWPTSVQDPRLTGVNIGWTDILNVQHLQVVNPYTEMQIHGGVSTKDIDYVILPHHDSNGKANVDAMAQLLTEAGIPWIIRKNELMDSYGGAVERRTMSEENVRAYAGFARITDPTATFYSPTQLRNRGKFADEDKGRQAGPARLVNKTIDPDPVKDQMVRVAAMGRTSMYDLAGVRERAQHMGFKELDAYAAQQQRNPDKAEWFHQIAAVAPLVDKVRGQVAPDEQRVEVNIGVTPYRGDPKTTVDDAEGYYSSTRYKGWLTDVRMEAHRTGITIHDVVKAAGVWKGTTEPSASIWASGTDKQLRDFAGSMGGEYNQEGVTLFRGDDTDEGNGALYTMPSIQDRDKAIQAMMAEGVDNGRLTTDKDGGFTLEVIDMDGSAYDSVTRIGKRLGVAIYGTPGKAELLMGGTHYQRRSKPHKGRGDTWASVAASATGGQEEAQP